MDTNHDTYEPTVTTKPGIPGFVGILYNSRRNVSCYMSRPYKSMLEAVYDAIREKRIRKKTGNN